MFDLNEIHTLFKKIVRLLSSEAKNWKSRVVSEANKFYVKNPQKQLTEPLKCKKPWTNIFKPNGDKPKQNSRICMSPTALKRKPSQSDYETANWNTSSHTANETQLQLEAQSLRKPQDLEQQAARITHEREVKLRDLRDQSAAQPQLLKTQLKNQTS